MGDDEKGLAAPDLVLDDRASSGFIAFYKSLPQVRHA